MAEARVTKTLRILPDLATKLEELARDMEVSENTAIEAAIKAYLIVMGEPTT